MANAMLKKPEDPEFTALKSQYEPVRQGYEAARDKVSSLSGQRASLLKNSNAMPIVEEGPFHRARQRGYSSATPGFQPALSQLDQQIATAVQEREAFAPKLQESAKNMRSYADRTAGSTLLRTVGAAPIAAPATTTPVTAAPNFSDVRSGTGGPVQTGKGAVTTPDPASRVVGTFNGRTITQADADALASKLPTSNGPVVSSGGNFAYSTGGGAGGTGGTTAGAPVGGINAERVQTPTLVMPRTLSGDLDGAEKERQQRLSDIDSAMFGLRGNLNSRGHRDLYATLLGQQNQLTRDRVNQVTGLETEGARLANAGAIEQARLGTQVGEGNANRALEADRVNSGATLRREELADNRNQPNRTLRDTTGNTTLMRNDGSLTPLTNADGKPFREATENSSVTDATLFEAYRKDLAAINENALLKPEERAAMQAEVEARPEYQSVLSRLRGAGQGAKPGAKPSLDQFLEHARTVNPGVSDADLTAYYNREYGG